MPRPVLPRIIDIPAGNIACFKPCRRLPKHVPTLTLKVEELEALRLADYEGATQSDAARCMGVSRHTFGRILAGARKKTAQALLTGTAIDIAGGNHARRQTSQTVIQENKLLKIAISAEGPTLDDAVDPKFGRAGGFVIFDTESGEHTYVNNGEAQTQAQGAGLKAAELVAAQGANVVLSGYVGPKAFTALQAAGIRVVQDMDNRTVRQALEAFKDGKAEVLS